MSFFINALNNPEVMQFWETNGKAQTEKSFDLVTGCKLAQGNADYRKYAEQLSYYTQLYYVDQNFQCVHASLVDEDPSMNVEATLLWERNIANEYAGKLTVVGHTPLTAPLLLTGFGDPITLPYNQKTDLPKSGMINIDTGCVFGRKLTAMIIEEDQYYLDCVERIKGTP